ncbi:hypothetical protein BOX15_Mlig024392g2, partial [Macrostomum lignano]
SSHLSVIMSQPLPNEVPEEDASELRFPLEFDKAQTLTVSEVRQILEKRKAANEQREEELEPSEVETKTLNYCQRFAKFNNEETISAVRDLLQGKKLHNFELAAIANLCPETAEEAKALIPSLAGRFEDEDLNQILEDLRTKISFQL